MTASHLRRSRLLGYGVGLAGPVVITLALLSVQHLLKEQANSAPYLFAVLVGAWVGGLGPATLAIVESCLAMDYFFLPRGPWLTVPDLVWLCVFVCVSAAVAWLTVGRRGAAARAALALEHAQTARAEAEVARADRESLLLAAERSRREAEAANRAKDEFLATLSHELRNPLQAIGNAVALLDRVGTTDVSAAARARVVVKRQVQHLVGLVDDLLDVARVATGKIVLNRRPLDLGQVVRRGIEDLGTAGRTAGHRVVYEGGPIWVEADATRLEQIVDNLLTNALKYTPTGGTICVSVTGEGREAILCVTDTGIGIPAEKLTLIFDLFFQSERAVVRSQGGLGIGLSLVRRLVELHGGTVTASSAGPGCGSTFTVRLPITRRPARRTTSMTARDHARPSETAPADRGGF